MASKASQPQACLFGDAVVILSVPTPLVDAEIVRSIERGSIRAFLEERLHFIRGNVLDYGAGHQPYRDLLETNGIYHPYDKREFPCSKTTQDVGDLDQYTWDTVVCTQVVQYLPRPVVALSALHSRMSPDGHLLLTFPTVWEEIEDGDLYRFTAAGMRRLLHDSGFRVLEMVERARITLGLNLTFRSFDLTLGYGVVAQPL